MLVRVAVDRGGATAGATPAGSRGHVGRVAEGIAAHVVEEYGDLLAVRASGGGLVGARRGIAAIGRVDLRWTHGTGGAGRPSGRAWYSEGAGLLRCLADGGVNAWGLVSNS